MNKEYLNEACKALESKLPDNHGFIVLTMPFNDPSGRLCYASSLRREDAIKVLKTWLIKASGEEEWMKHIK